LKSNYYFIPGKSLKLFDKVSEKVDLVKEFGCYERWA